MMNKKFSKTEIKGLPGGPNKQFTYVTGVFLQDMYHAPIAQKGLEKYQGNKKSETLVPKEKLDRYLKNTQAKLIDDSGVPLYEAYDNALPTPTVRAYNVPTTAEKFGMIGSTLKDKAIETAKTLKDYSPIGAAERIYKDPKGSVQFISDVATLNKAPDLSNWMKMLDVAEVTPFVGLGAKGLKSGYNALRKGASSKLPINLNENLLKEINKNPEALKKLGLKSKIGEGFEASVYDFIDNQDKLLRIGTRDPEDLINAGKKFWSDQYLGLPISSKSVDNSYATLMNKVPGTSLKGMVKNFSGDPIIDQVIPRKAIAEAALKLRKLKKENIHLDWQGDNITYDPITKKIGFYDFDYIPIQNEKLKKLAIEDPEYYKLLQDARNAKRKNKENYFTELYKLAENRIIPKKQQGGEGYRINAPNYNDSYKIIPSGNITMTEKDGGPLKKGPLLGIDNLGNQQMMFPGYEYQFPGNMVMEIPVAQKGNREKKAQYLNSEVFDDLKEQSKKSTGVIEQAEEVSLPNRILNAMAQPMTYRANKNQGINSPYVIGLNPFDIALAYVNPTVAFKTGKNAIEETAKGNYGNALLNAAYTASYLPYLKALPLKQDGGTSWTDYLNPFNWGAKNMDDAGDFKTAFRTARGAGYDDFMWQGKRYSTEIAEQPDYENLFYDKSLLDNLSDKQKQRREALLYNADLIAKSQGDNEDLRRMLIMTAAMENSLGADPNAYGRDYTRGPMSIDNIAWQDVFDVREGANNYTAQQKKNEKWLNSLGLDMNNLETLLRSDDPLASMAVARLVYGRIPEALPSGDDPKAMFDYYLNYYNRKGLLKHGTAEQHYARFLKDYNRIYKKSGGEFQRLVDKYTTKGWNSLTDKEKQEYKNYYNNM